jgi:hypothetical protein
MLACVLQPVFQESGLVAQINKRPTLLGKSEFVGHLVGAVHPVSAKCVCQLDGVCMYM